MKVIITAEGRAVQVDDDTFEALSKHKWRISGSGYPMTTAYKFRADGTRYRTTISMHQMIMVVQHGLEVDHIDKNKLNNRRENLRTCTRSQNLCNGKLQKNNTSGHKGVRWHKASKKWIVTVKKNGVVHYFGVYADLKEAVEVRTREAKRLHGEFYRER